MPDHTRIPRIPLEKLKTFKGRCEYLYKIQNKSGKVVPFDFLQAQDVFNDIVNEEFERTKRENGVSQCRIIAVKPRQVGWTTFSNIKSLDMQINDSGSNGVISAHDSDTTSLIYRIYDRAYKFLPEEIIVTDSNGDMTRRDYFSSEMSKPDYKELVGGLVEEYGEANANNWLDSTHIISIKPETKSHSGNQIEFVEEDNDSITVIFTAGKGDAGGKAGTLRRVHFSECANYKEYKKLMTSIGPAVPDSADNVFFILESTANGTTGAGEGFYKAWQNSVEEWERYTQGKQQTFSGFRPVFIPWYMIEEYEKPLSGGKLESIEGIQFSSPEEKRQFLDQEQQLMNEGIFNPLTQEMVKVSIEKINWYRHAIKTRCEYDYNDARRYYPTTPQDAFIASSETFFDSMKLNEAKNKKLSEHKEHEIGEIELDASSGEPYFQPSATGNLKIIEPPVKDYINRYVIGADIGRGYDDGDYSTAYVFDRLTQKYVAIWHGKADQDIFATILMEIGLYYNEAYIIPEANLETVINIIKPDGDRPYIGEIYYDENLNRYGFLTHKSTRQILIDKQKAWLRDNPLGYDVLPDIETIDEYLAFVRKKTAHGVKYEADDGHFDDRVIGSALCKYGDDAYDLVVEEYKPNKLMQIISSKDKKRKKFIKQSQLGRRKN